MTSRARRRRRPGGSRRRAPFFGGRAGAGFFAGPSLRTKRTNSEGSSAAPEMEEQIAAARAGGRPLSGGERAFFEPRMGADLGDIRLHDDARADRLAGGVEARAFTTGRDVFFAAGQYSPQSREGRHLLAHELTHTVQQGATSGLVQRYTTYTATDQTTRKSLGWKHPGGGKLEVADDGTLARGGAMYAWATQKRIQHAESVLKSVGSEVKLTVGASSISGKLPRRKGKGGKKKLKQVDVVNRSGGGRADLTADCGSAARQIMGIKPSIKKFSGVRKRRGVERYTKAERYPFPVSSTTESWVDEIYKKEWPGLTKAQARARYAGMSARKKKKFDKKYGLNKYAVPKIGQAITANRPKRWNFHFAGAILKGGPDYITAENFPAHGRTSQSWYFKMYGPAKKGQTFHQRWARPSGTTTMVVESLKARQGKTTAAGVHLVKIPRKWREKSNRIGKLAKGTEVDVIAKGKTWRKVKVKTGTYTGRTGWIKSMYYTTR